tara:strand:- start:321 stop:1670 length:1350 start_codon:yes stop_codon:yes gene_type:complete
MNITQKEIAVNTLILSVKMQQSDYIDAVESSLLDYRKKINMPGFRAGKVPMSIVKKKYELAVKVEEINKILSSSVQKYISDKKLSILGNPMPLESNIDFIQEVDYVFDFELGLQPKIDLSKVEKYKLDYYVIQPDKKQIDEHILSLQKRYGNVKSFETMQDGDMITVFFQQLNKDKSINKDGVATTTTVLVDKIEDSGIKKKILKLKKFEKISFLLNKAFTNMADLASMLKISKDEAQAVKSEFSCEIKDIQRLVPSELDVDFFKKSFPEKEIKTQKSFQSEVKSQLIEAYSKESDRKLFNDGSQLFLNKIKIDFPEKFLKKWLKSNVKKEFNSVEFEQEYNSYLKYLSWQLIENTICLENNIKIDNDKLRSFTKSKVLEQMKSYGSVNIGDKEIEGIVDSILKNQKESDKMMNEIVLLEIVGYFKTKIKVNKKDISFQDFIKLANNQK